MTPGGPGNRRRAGGHKNRKQEAAGIRWLSAVKPSAIISRPLNFREAGALKGLALMTALVSSRNREAVRLPAPLSALGGSLSGWISLCKPSVF